MPLLSVLTNLLGMGALFGNSLIGGVSSAYNARKQYKYNLALQNDAQEHQKEMFQNQHQWEVQDLRNAGLNPILSTHAGSSMPSAGMNSVSAQNYTPDLIGDLAELQGFSSARDMQKFNRENHEVGLAQKEVDLALKEVTAKSAYETLESQRLDNQLKEIEYERLARPWYKEYRDLKDILSTTAMDHRYTQFADDFLTKPWLRLGVMINSSRESKNRVPVVVRKEKGVFTKYKYKTR